MADCPRRRSQRPCPSDSSRLATACVFEGEPGPHLLNPLGGVHGGWALTLIDTVTGCAAHSILPAGVGFATIETKANFSRPIAADTGRVRAEGRVVGKGRTIISAEGGSSTRADACSRTARRRSWR